MNVFVETRGRKQRLRVTVYYILSESVAGEVLFVQFDLTGRVGLESAADYLLRNIVTYLDDTNSGTQDKRIAYLGTDDDEVRSLRGLSLRLTEVDPSLASMRDLRDRLVLIGAGLPAKPSEPARRQIEAHVSTRGTVLLLPQAAEQLKSWPTATRKSWARVESAELGAGTLLLRGVRPQLMHWRNYLDVDLIDAGSLPALADHLLHGLLVEVPDQRGRWICSQLDWREVDSDVVPVLPGHQAQGGPGGARGGVETARDHRHRRLGGVQLLRWDARLLGCHERPRRSRGQTRAHRTDDNPRTAQARRSAARPGHGRRCTPSRHPNSTTCMGTNTSDRRTVLCDTT